MIGFKVFLLLAVYVAMGIHGYRLRAYPWFTHIRSIVLALIALITCCYGNLQAFIYVCIGILYGFYVIPQFLIANCNNLVYRGDYSTAKYYMAVCCLLDPSQHYFQAYRFYTVMSQVASGDCEQKQLGELVETFSENPFSHIAKISLYFIEGRYEDVLNHTSFEDCEKNSALRPLRWGALGELGQLEQLVSEMYKMRNALRPRLKPEDCLSLRSLAAYTGHEGMWRLYANRLFSRVSPIRSRFWEITYHYVQGGDIETYQEKLNWLSDEACYWDKRLIENRLKFGVIGSNVASLSGESLVKLDEMASVPAKKVRRPFQFKEYFQELSTAYATIALFLVFAGLHILRLSLPLSQQNDSVYRFAFLYPMDLILGHWWHVFTTLFVFRGGSDFWLNLLMFIFFPGVEKKLGHWRFAILFLLSAWISMALAIGAWSLFSLHPNVQLHYGLPSAISGIWGAITVMAYMEWRHQGVESSQTRFWRVLAYVLFITWMEISFYKNGATFWIHVFGFMSGLTLTAIFMNSTWKDLNATLKKSKLILAAWGVVLCALILVGVNTVSHCKQLNAEQLGQYGYYFFEAGDMNRSTLWYLKSAHAGDAESQEWVGREFAFGYNVPIDETVGRDWLKKAVAQGNAQAAQDLARLEASHENYDRALDWAEKAFILEKNPKTHAEIQIYIRKLELEKKTP